MVRVARVEPLTTARSLRGPFDYLLTDRLGEVRVGSVLEVPFGPRKVVGVVVGLEGGSDLDEDRLREPIRSLGEGTTPELVEIGLRVAREYCSTPARGLGLVLPPGTGAGGRRVRERTERICDLTDAGREAIEGGERLGPKQRAALSALSAGPMSTSRLAAEAGVNADTVRRLADRGLIGIREDSVRRTPEYPDVGSSGSSPPDLTSEQAEALATIVGEIGSRAPAEPFLLSGVTGSGKTEVYLGAVEAALGLGLTAIVLVPEIGLTPQAVSRFRARLGDRVAVLHSGLTDGQRHDEWERLRKGEATVCVGPRSAVFAPLRNLGLIVIDEEHDSSYKQESDPRYDAREVARMRSETTGAVLVLGTATPRPETWLSHRRLELPVRVDGIGMPPVEVIDMRGADPRGGTFHPRTVEALTEVRERGEKAIVMINRRGFAPWLTCRTCGHHWGCPNCDVSLIVHGEGRSGSLVCHHCAHREPLPVACPECGGTTLAQSGAGTERVEAELVEMMDPMPVLRLDADTGSGGGHGRILQQFDRSDSAILVGTQMVAKGHDFPEVTLSVLLDADATLRFPDFRAEERTFSLVTQLAGRSGRGPAGGRVLVQTLAPGAPSIEAASIHDAPGFLAGELERRRELAYPPFSDLIRLVLASTDESRLNSVAGGTATLLGDLLPGDATLLGPAPMFRTRGRNRQRLLIKTTDREASVDAVREAVERLVEGGELRGIVLSVDVGPQ